MANTEPTEKQREQRRNAAAARHQALIRLKNLYPEAYREFYNDECVKRGIKPQGARRDLTLRTLRKELDKIAERIESSCVQ